MVINAKHTAPLAFFSQLQTLVILHFQDISFPSFLPFIYLV